jgi:hypothetical protein
VLLRLHATHEALDFVLQNSAENGRDDGAFPLGSDVGRVGVGVGEQGEQLSVQTIEKITHKLVSVLLLIASGKMQEKYKWPC